jgi:antitoxin component YwqK of YwqJK toxin-antitoxin module
MAVLAAGLAGCGGRTQTGEPAGATASTKDTENRAGPSKPLPLLPERETLAPTLVRTETIVLRYPDKKPYVRRQVKAYSDESTVNHGPYVSFYGNGQKFEEGEFVDGKKQGVWHMWNENGTKAKDENYVDGELDGNWTLFDEKGAKVREVGYKAGNRDGKWTYYEDGKVVREESYEHDKLHGIVRLWFPNGQKSHELNYDHGVPVGMQQQWHPNGQLWRQTSYRNGKLHGKAITWNDKGEKVEDLEFEDGNRKESQPVAKGG